MFQLAEQALTAETYCKIRETAGFAAYSKEDAAAALKHTLYTVEVRDGGVSIAIARVVGDGRIVFLLKDVVVDPAYQGKGIGRMLMEAVFSYLRQNACDNAYVGLMATPGTERFYERFGFIRRPAPGLGHGMVQFFHPAEPYPESNTRNRLPPPQGAKPDGTGVTT